MAAGFKKDFQYYKFCLYGFLKNQKFYEPFFLLFLLSKDISYFQVGLLYSIREITINLFEIPAGIIADSAGRRKSMLVSFVFYIISFAAFYFSGGFAILTVAMVIFGLGDVFRTGTHKAIIFSYLEANKWSDQKVDYYGHTRSWSQFGSAISSLIAAAIVIVTNNYSMVFAFAVIPYLLNLVNLATYPSWLDGRTGKFKMDEFRPLFIARLKSLLKAFKDFNTTRLFINSSLPSGFFKSVKDYLQPLILTLVISVPVFQNYNENDKSSILLGLVYFLIFILSGRASRLSGRFSSIAGSISKGMNRTYILMLIAAVLAGLLYHLNLEIYAIALFILLYLAENVRRPIAVSGIADRLGNESLSTFLSTDSQLKSVFTMILSPVAGYFADLISPGAGIMITALILLSVFPVLRLK